ncbi:DNA topoisomerase IV subunit A [Schleiferilactobacillus harbinensis]|uniref:DNA topoisomerase IV subunit A n=1 Tax=Schleiferilactobacillus harbinensis TaxID=304207 RepID=UPI001238948C|nr:DNA topoisomerase IV subunit A [Schleiferilactobacillus harbinensis]QEU46543.1 DNA topoisomerase IV subunit A [Schleiferilactobacillus harbinensis]
MAETENIKELSLEDVMGERFGRYSKYIIQERALPDIRDGLKPVQRRILYAMNEDHNTYDKAYRKAAKSVGNVMGNFHPHGDSSIYEALVRMSQEWKLRLPLIQMHGNNGSMDGDPPAAMRYTEARLSKAAGELLTDIDKETVPMVLNFDDTQEEPTVLPARFPNLLVNGATGISAGYATEIPPHNLGEVIDAAVYLLAHPQADLADLMQFVKGPDFPTGGIVQGLSGIKEAYTKGRGRIVVRAKTTIADLRGGRQQIVVTEIPYEVNKAMLVKRIDELRVLKKVEGISEVRDESDRFGLSIVIELKKNADAQGILNYLFKNTDLQISYNFNMVAIRDARPEQLGLQPILTAYLDFRKEVVTKRTQYVLQKALDREHIVEGLIHALSILDKVIKTIRGSKDKGDAKKNLVSTYGFTPAQAEAIVSLQLYRLTNTDVTELEAEHAKLSKEIARYQQILGDPKELAKVIKTELLAVKKEYATPRLTQIEKHVASLDIDTSVLVSDEEVMMGVSRDGYLKRASIRSFNMSDDGDNGLKENDQFVFQGTVHTLDHVYMFTSAGNMIYRQVFEIQDGKWKDTGEHVSQTTGLAADEKIIYVKILKDLSDTGRFVLGTADGQIKQLALSDFQPSRTYKSRAQIAMKLKGNGDLVTDVFYVANDQDWLVTSFSRHGYATRYPLNEVSAMGGRAAGVRSQNLKGDDTVVNFLLIRVEDNPQVGIVTSRGAFKRMAVEQIPDAHRGGVGVLVLRVLKSNPHQIVLVAPVASKTDWDVLTDAGRHIDIKPMDHPLSDRYSNGSFILDVDTDGLPVSFQPVAQETVNKDQG